LFLLMLSMMLVCGRGRDRGSFFAPETMANARRHPCSFEGCDSTFASPSALQRHIRTHTGERPYVCSFEGCDYACSDASSLRTHIRTHTGEKPFACSFEGCDYACSTTAHLRTHIRTHTGERPFVCSFEGCDYACSKASHLRTHIRTHTGERPYFCSFEGCDYACSTSSALRAHNRTHTGEKPYSCACGRAFTAAKNLAKHVQRVHGAQPSEEAEEISIKVEGDDDGCSSWPNDSGGHDPAAVVGMRAEEEVEHENEAVEMEDERFEEQEAQERADSDAVLEFVAELLAGESDVEWVD
jgi:uncharacterized Zn-finger protein